MRSLFYLTWVFTVMLTLVCIGMIFIGVLIGFDRLAGAGAVLIVPSMLAIFSVVIWSEDHPPEKKPKLTRAMRKQLKEEQGRIHMEAEIKRLETEAGLRD